jgi:hypothetical protein
MFGVWFGALLGDDDIVDVRGKGRSSSYYYCVSRAVGFCLSTVFDARLQVISEIDLGESVMFTLHRIYKDQGTSNSLPRHHVHKVHSYHSIIVNTYEPMIVAGRW